MINKSVIVRYGAVIATVISFSLTFLMLIIYGMNAQVLVYDCCNVTFQNNSIINFTWPYYPHYNSSNYLVTSTKLRFIKCGYSTKDINGTFGGWYDDKCLGNACNIKDNYFVSVVVLIFITISLIVSTIIICLYTSRINKYDILYTYS